MRVASATSWAIAAVPGNNPGGGKTCIARYSPRDASAATANSQRGPNRNGRTINPASAYSVRMSPFQIRQRWMSPNASNTTRRRTSSDVRRSLLASRSNWMARPAPNSSENSASAFKSTASVRMFRRRCRSTMQEAWGRKTARRSKREISVTTLIATTPSNARPRNTSMASIRSEGPVGRGGVAPSAIATSIPVERRNEVRAPLYDSRISSSRRPSVLSIFFTALEAAISPWLA